MINQGYPPTTPTLKPKESFTSSSEPTAAYPDKAP